MTSSDLPSPAEALIHDRRRCQGFAQAGNRFTLFGTKNFSVAGTAINAAGGTYLPAANYACEMGNYHCP